MGPCGLGYERLKAPSTNGKTDVLYIGGVGRSGSTLLAYLLGQLEGYVVAGELKFIIIRGISQFTDNRTQCGNWDRVAAISAAELPPNLRLFIADPTGRDSYPIVTFSWILLHRTYDDPKKAKALRDFFHWCLSDGQRFASELGYVPLSSNVSSKSLAALGEVGPLD